MENKKTQLSVSVEVIEKMAEIAAKEIDGVAEISKKSIDIKGALKTKNAFKGIKIESINGAIQITVYISVKENAKVKDVAEKVQANIKEKIQNMTGSAVTQVNVIVADLEINDTEE